MNILRLTRLQHGSQGTERRDHSPSSSPHSGGLGWLEQLARYAAIYQYSIPILASCACGGGLLRRENKTPSTVCNEPLYAL
jgi:hypothetical protein